MTSGLWNAMQTLRLMVPRAEQEPQRVRCRRSSSRENEKPCCCAASRRASPNRWRACPTSQANSCGCRPARPVGPAPASSTPGATTLSREGPSVLRNCQRSPKAARSMAAGGNGCSIDAAAAPASPLRFSIHCRCRSMKSWIRPAVARTGATISTRPSTNTRALRRRARALRRTGHGEPADPGENSESWVPGGMEYVITRE